MVEENLCSDYNIFLNEYIKLASPLLERLKDHVRDCSICQQYLLENRDAFALQIISMPDEEFRDKMKQ